MPVEKAELIERLKGYEWIDVEFKEARRDVPRSAYETVSAFANTEGGWLVFGVRDGEGGFEVVGVLEVDKVQNDFLTTLRQHDKISAVLDVRSELHQQEDAVLLVFHIAEANRGDKPVYLNGDIRRSFIRKGGSDIRCSENERDRFLVDSMAERFDGQAVERAPDTAFDHDSIRWYRTIYEARPGNRSHAGLSDLEFLDEMGFFVEREGEKMPNRAAILLFGNNSAFRQLLPRPVVDCQRFALARAQADTGARWMDRSVLDENLIRTWRSLVDWYGRFAERPFRIDPASLQRDDTPPDYPAYRESMVNLLIHQDYSDHARKAEIRHYTDQTVFWNPGDAFASVADLLDPGEKEVRNPRVVTAFRRIGLSENAGWGLRDIFRSWQQLGNVPPRMTNDKSRKRFELVLVREELLSGEQILLQTNLGVRLTDEQARAFAFICRDGEATLAQLKAVTGLPGPDAAAVAERLATQRLIEPVGAGDRYALAEHLRERFGWTGQVGEQVDAGRTDMVTDQVGADTPDLSTEQVANGCTDLSTDQVDHPQENLVTDQVGRPTPDLPTGQVDPPTPDLPSRQVGPPTPDLPTSQVGPPTPDLHTDQVGPDPADLSTEQVDKGRTDLSTNQVGADTPDLSTAQIHRQRSDLSSAQFEPLAKLSATQRKIPEYCDVPRRLAEIMDTLGVASRGHFMKHHLDPLIRAGIVAMTNPGNPRASNQRYVVTDAGARLKARLAGVGAGMRGGG